MLVHTNREETDLSTDHSGVSFMNEFELFPTICYMYRIVLPNELS